MPEFKKKGKEYITTFVVFLSLLLIIIIFTQEILFTIAPLKSLELKFIDQRFLERGKISIEEKSKVLILEIDQESFDQIPPPYNKWPWPRTYFKNVIENLTKAGVKAIGIDIIMPSADQFSIKNDEALIEAIKKYKNVVVAGKIDESIEQRLETSNYSLDTKYNYNNIFYDADSSLGIVQPPPDYDMVHRRYLPFRYTDISGQSIPSFGFALVSKYYGLNNTQTATRVDDFFILGSKKIPRYDATTMLVNFYGGDRTFRYVKFIDVLDDKRFKTTEELEYGEDVNRWESLLSDSSTMAMFKDKIVLIGSTMPEDRDILAVSFAKGKQTGDNTMYGVEFHANAIQNILSDNYLVPVNKTSEIMLIVFLSALTFFGSSVTRKIKIKHGYALEILNILLVLVIILAIYKTSVYMFVHQNIVNAIVHPALSVVTAYIGSTAYHFIKERKQNLFIKGMFSQYVNKDVLTELLANPEKLKLGGEKKNLTILFSDIAGFTTFAENKEPEELVSFINEILNELTKIIIANNGTLDKYIGDAVMAFWGAPMEVKDHAYKACLTSLQMQQRLGELREKWSKTGEAQIKIRIGINSGNVIVGNTGSDLKLNYTVLGDNVNLASRLEGANKEYGSNIMISGSTYDLVKEQFYVRELDTIRVKGKTEPTKVYELVSLIGDAKGEEAIKEMDFYVQGLYLFRQKSFEPAMDYFKRSFEKLNDYPSKVYMERCKFYISNPPPQNWDGVFDMKSK